MQSYLYHLQINIDFKNISFYKDLLIFMGWSIIFEDRDVAGFTNKTRGDLWFTPVKKDKPYNYDSIGVNHISLGVYNIDDVNKIQRYLEPKNISMLFDTPRYRPEYTHSPGETYYQIMFESPDKVLFEIVYIGPKIGE